MDAAGRSDSDLPVGCPVPDALATGAHGTIGHRPAPTCWPRQARIVPVRLPGRQSRVPTVTDSGGHRHTHSQPADPRPALPAIDRPGPAESRLIDSLADPSSCSLALLPSLTLKRDMEREKHVVDVGAVDMGISGEMPGRSGKTGSDRLGRSCPQLHSGLIAAFVRSDVLPNGLIAVHPLSPVLPTRIPRKPAVVRRVVHTSTGLSTPSDELSTRYPRRSGQQMRGRSVWAP